MAALNESISDWRGRRVWIAGASSGIGASLASRLLRAGAKVCLTARNGAALEEIAAIAPGCALPLVADVTDALALRRAHDQMLAKWGGIDLVVWLAGTYTPMRAHDFDLQAALDTLDTNLNAVYNGLSVVLPTLLRQRSGGVALVSSVAGYRGLPRSLAYGPSKAALHNLAESLYLDLRPLGVSTYLINPGFVRTRLTAGNDFHMPALIDCEQACDQILKGFAAGRFEIHFPARFTLVLKLLRLLPYRAYFALIRAFTGSDRAPTQHANDALR
jgi:NAD(P)-dependent dehydrogenase (short-subunit alcohol dehydrogenase family)